MVSSQNTVILQGQVVLPASAAQQRFWVSDQIKKGDPALNVAVRFSLSGQLNFAALRQAMNAIVARHEILRSNFRMVNGEVSQVVEDNLALDLPLFDLSAFRGEDQNAEAIRLADEFAREPFSLDQGPLLRTALLKLGATEHVLLLTLHHIICDGWSIGVFTDELGSLYAANSEGSQPCLPALPIQYADYTLWQKENASTQQTSERYWTDQLAGAKPCELSTDFARQTDLTSAGQIASRLLPRQLTDRLLSLSQKLGATLFMTTLAGFSALLSRHLGLEEVAVSTQVAGREQVEVESLIGPFVNTAILRVSTMGDPRFTEILDRTKQVVEQALTHCSVPFDRVVELLRIRREPGRTPIADISFLHQRDFVHPWEYAGLELKAIPSRSPGVIYDLNVFMVERADGWRLSCEYDTSLFREQTVQNLLAQFETLLASVAHNPEQRLSRLPLLSSEQEHQLLVEWNQTGAEYPRQSRIHDLLTGAAVAQPKSVAAVCSQSAIDYASLDSRCNQLARYLSARGAAPGSVIGICLHRSLDMLAAVLATLKTGAAYLPLDPALPTERLQFLMQDSGVSYVVTQSHLAETLGGNIDSFFLDAEDQAISRESSLYFDGGATAEDTAYVLYTSGSTGKPKGVEVPHRAVVNLLYSFRDILRAGPDDVLLATTTLSFDIAALELFAPLLTGSKLVIADDNETNDPTRLRDLFYRSGATIFQATPVRFRMLIEAGWRNTPKLTMLCGGEKMTRELADQLLARGGVLWNVYGPTETTVWSTAARIEADAQPITVGRPLSNTTLYILDSHLNPVPMGAAGELFIGGDGVARGYRNRKDLTAERFLENPFGSGRIYKTGDRARYLADGRVELLGRNDDQVKIRGFRIELGEVEAVLQRCPYVSAGAVTVCEDGAGEPTLAAHFVLRSTKATATDVREFLASVLPAYMVPTFFTPMTALPTTASGKVDRKQLLTPMIVAPLVITEPVADQTALEIEVPADELEAALIGVWTCVLGCQTVRPSDDFFELGGHSVMAARMFSKLEKLVGHAMPLATLFKAPTVRQLAAVIRENAWAKSWSTLVPIRENGNSRPLFLIHPIGGNVLNFSGFCSHFDADQPVYGLQARGLDKHDLPHTDIEAMAEEYVDNIRKVQPKGPYQIGGFSAGGVVAFEMARQLEKIGESVSVLALLDSKIDTPASAKHEGNRGSWTRTVFFNVRYAMRSSLKEFVVRKVKNLKMRAAVRTALLLERIGAANHASFLDAEEAFLLALRRYVPKPYGGRGILFRAKDELVRYPDPNLGWDQVVMGGIEVREVSGDHDTLMQEPHIGELATVLQVCLQQAERAGSVVKRAPQVSGSTWRNAAPANA